MKPIDNKQLNKNYPGTLKGGTRVGNVNNSGEATVNPHWQDGQGGGRNKAWSTQKVEPKMPNKQ